MTEKKVQHNFLAHVMPVFASHDTDDFIYSTIVSVVQDDQNEMQPEFFSHSTLLALASAT